MFEIRLPTLELNWLPLSMRKALDRVRIVCTGDTSFGGRYWHREFGGKPVLTPFDCDLREAAIIEIGASPNASTLAHEYRHHWQHQHNFFQPFRAAWNPPDAGWDSHWEEVRRYFSVYPEERDALDFEVKVAPADLNLWRTDFLLAKHRHV